MAYVSRKGSRKEEDDSIFHISASDSKDTSFLAVLENTNSNSGGGTTEFEVVLHRPKEG